MSPSQAQQFPLLRTSYESFELTPKCLEALDTVLDCSVLLMSHVKSDGIEEICTKNCGTSLSDLRTKIQNDCYPKHDVFDHNLALYPATYIVDRYIYVYDISCYKHRDTGNACDYVLGEWRNEPDSTPRECDDCILGPMQLEANSPFGHAEARAGECKVAIFSCSVKGYAYTSPPPYVQSQTSTSPESPTVAPQDCIGVAQKVPTRDLVEANDKLDGWCGGLEAGMDLCLPAKCKVHLLKPEDSCESLLEGYSDGQKSLAEWNPRLYIQCDNLNAITGYICVGPPVISKRLLNAPVAVTNNT
ncbi:hypothetical protein CSHISOI_05145, partial [Colletotrichum shisoi]